MALRVEHRLNEGESCKVSELKHHLACNSCSVLAKEASLQTGALAMALYERTGNKMQDT